MLVLGGDRAATGTHRRAAETHEVRNVAALADVVIELRVVGLLFDGVQVDLLVLHTELDRVAFPAEERRVVLERPALLPFVLQAAFAAADAVDLLAIIARAVGQHAAVVEIDRRLGPERFFIGQMRVVEPIGVGVLPTQVVAVLFDAGIGAVAARTLPADVADLAFLTTLVGQLDQVLVVDRPIQLAEVQVFLERRGRRAQLVAPRLRQVAGKTAFARLQILRRVVLLALVGDEEVRLVLDDRSTERRAVLLLAGASLADAVLLALARLTPILVGVIPEERALEFIGAGLGHRRHRRRADLVVLGLVVGGDDLVLADGQLRERIAAARVLAGDAALGDVVLLAHAIDVDVDVVGVLHAATQLGRAIGRVLLERHARHGIGEGQEVARALRQRLDLLRRDVGGDFRGLGFDRRLRGHLHRVQRGRCPALRGFAHTAHAQVHGRGLADLHGDVLGAGLAACIDINAVGARRQAGQRVAASGGALHAAAQAGGDVGRGYLRLCGRRRICRDLATDGGASALRECGSGAQQQAASQCTAEQLALWSVLQRVNSHGSTLSSAAASGLPGIFGFKRHPVRSRGQEGPRAAVESRTTRLGVRVMPRTSLASSSSICCTNCCIALSPNSAMLTCIVVKEG
ncbi:hypothetical protein D3C71_795980 [compost metagenome]